MKRKPYILTLLTLIALLLLSEAVFAKGGGHNFGVGAGIATAAQDDINNYVTSLNLAGTKAVPSAYEAFVQYGYRFGTFGILFRPSYLMQSASGGGVTVSMTGITFMPMLRIYPLENKFMKFILQVGAGYGMMNGKITNGSSSVNFSGGTFGAQAGIGADFCFSPAHCLSVEGNLRYMPIVRNLVTATTGNMGGSIGTPVNKGELESTSGGLSNDVGTTLGGLVATAGYTMYF